MATSVEDTGSAARQGAARAAEQGLGLRQRGERALARAREVLTGSQWRVDARDPRSGDRVESTHVPGLGRVFLVTATYECSQDVLWKVLCEDIEKLPTWCNLFSKAYQLQVVDAQTDVMYHETSARGGGLVAPRDWVSLRHWERAPGAFQSAAVSVDVPISPDGRRRSGNVRGETLISMYSVDGAAEAGESAEGRARSRFRFLSCCRLGGWLPLPQAALDRFFVPSYMDFAASLRAHVQK